MPRGAGVFSPNGELRAANLVQVEDLFVKAAGSDQRGFQRIPGDAATFSQPGGKRVHLQQSSEVGAALGIGAEPQMQHRRRSGADGRSPGAPLFWKGERLECAPGGHEIVDRMHHQRIGADVCQYNSDSAVRQVRSSELRGFEASGGPPSNVEKLKARYDRRLLERQRVWRDYGHDLAAQVSRNSGRREGAWLAWLEQQQQATAAHNVSATGNDAPSEAGEAEDDPEDEDELHRMMRLGHGDLPYRANVGCGGRPGDKHQAAPIQWPQSFDPSGIGPISSDPKDYAVDLENGWNDGFAALSDGISEVESIIGELWNEIGAVEGTSGDQHELGLPPASQAPTRAEERANTSESTTVQPEPAEAPTSRQQSQLRHDEPPRGRWAVVSEGKAVRDAMLLRDRGGTHVAIGEGAVTPGGQREALEDRLMSSQHQIERFTNAALGDSESEGWRRGARAAPVVRSETADGLGFLVPPPEELCAEAADAPSSTTEAQRQRREAAALYLVKARGRMFESPSNAQRTYHEGAHVATSMGIPGAGIMACFEKDKAVHERDPPKQRPSKSDIIAADMANSGPAARPPRWLPQRNSDSHSASNAAETKSGQLPEAVERVQRVRQARDAKRFEIHAQQHESMLKEERRQGTEEARKHRYVDSPLKPKIDRETGRIPLVVARSASFGSDAVGSPRYAGLGNGITLAAQPMRQPQTSTPQATPKRSVKSATARPRKVADRAVPAPSTSADAEVPPDV